MVVEKGDIGQRDAESRILQQQRLQAKLEDAEIAKVPANLPSYVTRGLLTQDEATAVEELHEVDQQEEQRKIDKQKAAEVRDSIMLPTDREQLKKKVRKATVETVSYLQVFESLKKIHTQFDDALRLLIRHKRMVVAEEADDDRSPLIRSLIDNKPLLASIVDIMERKDPEIRLLDVRLPPYNAVLKGYLEKIDNLTIEEGFMDDLRNLSEDEMSERLNSVDEGVRVRPAADMRCFIHLVDHVIKRTRFRKKVRMLRVAQSLEEFKQSIEDIYRSTEDGESAKKQAEQFLNRRLQRLFSDMAPDEADEIKQRTAATLAAAEQTVNSVHTNEVDALLGPEPTPAAEPQEDDLELSDEEVQKGVQIGRVEMRIAGRNKRVPQKLMPDPDDPQKTCIAQRDPDTDELVPQIRRGAKRYIVKGRDGGWILDKQ
jgi:hypothetical protein